MMADCTARRNSLVLLVAAFDRIARSTKNFWKSWMNSTTSKSSSFQHARQLTPADPWTDVITLIGSIAELEKSILVERSGQGCEGQSWKAKRLGRAPLNIDHDALVRDRLTGMSLTNAARNMVYPEPSVVPVRQGSAAASERSPREQGKPTRAPEVASFILSVRALD